MTQRGKTWLIALLAAAGGGFVVAVCAGVIALLYFGVRESFEPPEDARMWIVSPDQVKRGEAFTIEVHVANDSIRPRTLPSIDMYDSYLEGVRLRSSQPPWQSSSHVFDFTTYAFDLTIPPRGTQVVKFQAVAIRDGDFQGDIDACIDSDTSCLTEVVRTIVGDDPADE